MPRIDSDTKQKRIELVYARLERHLNGLTEQEIAGALNLQRRTVNNYLRELEIQGQVYKEGRLWLALPYQRTRLRRLDLSPEQAMTLYLATRLLVKQHDKRNESAETALVKLADALTGDAGVGQEIYQAAQELAHRPGDVEYSKVFRTIMQSYIYRRRVSIVYHPLRGSPFSTVFSPYLLEPSAIGYATYAIGHSSVVNALRTYKLERIEQAALTRDEYVVPPDFPGLDYLRSAWSIISGDELIEVKLRFSPQVARRVQESRWHPSQKVKDDPDVPRGCIWTAQIADLTDFIPWVRSWGADVEVQEPEELRQRVIDESRRLAALYKLAEIQPPPLHQLLWAKADKKTGQTHPLICHMIDVAQVALAMWNDVLTDGIRAQFSAALGLGADAAGRAIAFWAGLHDLGKASPCFQRRYPPAETTLAEAGLPFPSLYAKEACPHGTISGAILGTMLETETGLSRRLAGRVAQAVGGHHGEWPIPREMLNLKSTQKGDASWEAAHRELLQELAGLYDPPQVEQLGGTTQEANAFLTLLSGLTSTADWLGSMETFFRYATVPVDPVRYAEQAAKQAQQMLQKLGWLGWQPPAKARSFQELFQFSPNEMQKAVIDLARRLDGPSLVIIEAPTGCGKTEAALYLADRWAHTRQQRGLYVAMPTMATSNQMFGRVQQVLHRRYPHSLVNIHLIHSQARWHKDMQEIKLETFDDRKGGTVAAMAWFLPHKRSLLASFGVGTVDQTLLGVLQARHFFVRLFGLSHKTVVFDEVHAYDTYMSTIFQRLLGWLHAIGTSVVILSATLPAQTRRELVRAYAGKATSALPDIVYPTVTWATSDQVGVVPLQVPISRTIELEWIERDPQAIAHRLADALRDGGCAAVICNTIGRAQQIYQVIRDAVIVPERDLILFHARFPFAWRDEIERHVLDNFGKEGQRPHKAIVVATQVIEQSLDLDFDLMISDLAPVDLVLQRAGRLHRHDRNRRPAPLAMPCLILTRPAGQEGVPDFESDAWIYEPYVLLRSHSALWGRTQLTLPSDTETLIDAVYGEKGDLPIDEVSPAFTTALEHEQATMHQNRQKEQAEAQQRLVSAPDDRRLMNISKALLEEDKPELHRSLQALTRLIPPTVSLVCLHRAEGVLTIEPDSRGPAVDLEEYPAPDVTEQFARHTVSVSHRGVVNYFLGQPVSEGWREHPLLRNHHEVVFENGLCKLDGTPYILRLSRERGLEIMREDT